MAQAHGREALDRVVFEIAIEAGIDGQHAHGRVQQRIAVLGRIGHGLGAYAAASPGAVVHHHGLAQRVGHLLRHAARHQVGGAAGQKGHDQADGLVRVAARAVTRVNAGRGQRSQHEGGDEWHASHGICLRCCNARDRGSRMVWSVGMG
ncbi:hypothetical protein D3C71_1419030 [compost metagenome]